MICLRITNSFILMQFNICSTSLSVAAKEGRLDTAQVYHPC